MLLSDRSDLGRLEGILAIVEAWIAVSEEDVIGEQEVDLVSSKILIPLRRTTPCEGL